MLKKVTDGIDELLHKHAVKKFAAAPQGMLFEDEDMKEVIRAAQVREAAHANRRKKK